MKNTFNFRYHQDNHGVWHIDRRYLLFGFLSIWQNYMTFSKNYFHPFATDKKSQENMVLVFIRDIIEQEKRMAEHRNEYKLVDDNFFNQLKNINVKMEIPNSDK